MCHGAGMRQTETSLRSAVFLPSFGCLCVAVVHPDCLTVQEHFRQGDMG